MRSRHLFVAALLAAVPWSSTAAADNRDLEGLLDESVVTAASDTAETGRDAPATSTVITSDELRTYGIQTLSEALKFLALGVTAGQETAGNGDLGARGVTIAGSHWEHFLLLIDGVRANGVVYGEADYGPAAIPLDIVDHIEVILGPGSILYGSNAMLGVIHVVTKAAKDFSGLRAGIESGLWTNVRPWAGYGTTFELGGVRGEFTAEFEYYRQWGPALHVDPIYGGIDPSTGQPFRYTTAPVGTGVWGGADSSSLQRYESPSLVGRVRLGRFELSFNGQLASAPVRPSAVDFGTNPTDSSRRLLLNLAYNDQLSPIVALKSHAYLNASNGLVTITTSWAPDCSHPDINCRNEVLQQGVAGGVEVTPSFDWLKNGTLVTLVGADATVRSAHSIFNQYDAATNAPVSLSTGLIDHQDGALGAYVQQTWNPARMFGVNAGGRLDYDPRFSPVFSPRIAARVDPWRGGTLKVVYSEAFRAPSFFESYFSHPLNPLPVDLQPEHVRSVEASVEQHFAAQRLLFGAFGTQWTNLISYYNFSAQQAAQYVEQGKAILPPLYQYRNLSSVRNWGYNAAFEGTQASGALQYGVNMTAAITRLEDASGLTTPLTLSPRVFGNARMAYRFPAPWPTIALVASMQSQRAVENAFVSAFAPTPYVPMQVVLRATVSGDVPGVRGLSYRVTGFYSTTDHEPYLVGPNVEASSRYPHPSLVPVDRARVVLGLEYRFWP